MAIKYPSLSYPNQTETKDLLSDGKVCIQEKLDGANFRFKMDSNGNFRFGSRNQWGSEIHEDQFGDVMEYVEETVDVDNLRRLQQNIGEVTIFGEAMIPHEIDYYEETPLFIGYDIWMEEEERFSSQMRINLSAIGVEVAALHDIVDADEWDDYELEAPPSVYSDEQAEGVVLKNYKTDTYAKYVRPDFRESQKAGTVPEPASETERLIYQYVADARVRKAAHKLVDEGEYDELRMEMMPDLAPMVVRDVAKEEAGNIFMEENIEIETSELRSCASARCATVLREMVREQAREVAR